MKNALKFLLSILLTCTCVSVQSQDLQKLIKKVSKNNAFEVETLKLRLVEVNNDISTKGIILYEPDNSLLLTGYAYHECYDWDLYFENLYMSYYGVSDYCFSNIKSFLNKQCKNGFISRTLISPRDRQQFKPFIAQTAELGSRQTGDYKWLNERADRGQKQGKIGRAFINISYYEQIINSVEHWFNHCDFDRNGLPVWNSSDHSGMDNQVSRAGALDAFRYEGVDLACYLYREYKALQLMAEKLGNKEDAETFKTKANLLADKINTVFWDEKDGFYYDRDEYTGKLVKVKSVAGFIPMWVGIASPRRAERLVKEHLTNTNEFWNNYPVAGYARNEPDFSAVDLRDWGCNWRGTTWIPTNYMIFHGLIDYGYTDIAHELAKKTMDLTLIKNNVTREFYNGENGEGLGLKRFWGWSALAYMMPFEMELNYNPTALDESKIKPIGNLLFSLTMPLPFNPEKINNKLKSSY